MRPGRRSLFVGYLMAAVISLPVLTTLVAFNLHASLGGPPVSSISRNQWRHGWPLTFLCRRWYPYVYPGEERWGSRLLPPFWSPQWPWTDLHYGNRCCRFEPWALTADILIALFIGFATIHCAHRLLESRFPRAQFSMRFVLMLPLGVACGFGCCLYSGMTADIALTVLLLTGIACAAVVSWQALRWTAQRILRTNN